LRCPALLLRQRHTFFGAERLSKRTVSPRLYCKPTRDADGWGARGIDDEIIEIADDTSGDWVEKIGADGRAVMVVDHENIARARLKIKALEQQAARMAPKKYGNRR
jgi:hypothetical protein